MLLTRLPEEAWCQQPEGAPVERWSLDRELLAEIADHLVVIGAQKAYKDTWRVPRPESLTRGGDGSAAPVAAGRPASPAEQAAFFRSRRVRG